MNWESLLTLATVGGVFVLFIRQTVAIEFVALGAVAILVITGVLPAKDLLGVLSNPAALTVGCMFVLSAALDKTGVIDQLGKGAEALSDRAPRAALMILFAAVFVGSFFVNNTSVVLIMIPVVVSLARRQSLNASKLLIPLSYISILGGTCTLIGTSTNLLVDGVGQDLGQRPFGMFELTIPAALMATAGIVYMATFGRAWLPERQMLSDMADLKVRRRYLSQVTIAEFSPLIGKTLAETGLTRERDFEVVQHVRPASTSGSLAVPLAELLDRVDVRKLFRAQKSDNPEPVDMDTRLEAGDRLIITSDQRNILTADRQLGVTQKDIAREDTRTLEGVIAPGSNWVGRLIDEINYDEAYRVQIVAVHRQSGKIRYDFGRVRLSVGDTVLLKGEGAEMHRLVAEDQLINLTRPEYEPFLTARAPMAIAAFIVAIMVASLGLMPIAATAFLAVVAVLLTGCINLPDAAKSLQGNVLLLIYAMLAVSVAMERSGALKFIVSSVMQAVHTLPPAVVISILYLLTSAITEVFSNTAAAVMLTPIAIGMAASFGVDARPFVAAIMLGASASFATPLGYQTNLLVFNAGGYKFGDFLRVGLPLNVLLWGVASLLIPWYWKL
ncbi:SLC13 family permease [Asticcacaulis solisilvae]|uniref:SLC13 family permease n=1 Tax=Asticcacaulis solisilvae TaxID=1217274 RepID=UPI003FD77923